MYVPDHFREDDTQKLQQYIRQYGFGLLIAADQEGIEANHLPFLLAGDEPGSLGMLQCHLARNNPAWQRLGDGDEVLVVFQGPNAYISPSWYPSKAETGRVVPTWNYLAVHARGRTRVIEDAAWLNEHLRQLTHQHESERAEPWTLDDAPRDFIDRLTRGIVGIEIRLDTLTGKLKASQNQPEQNRKGVRAGLQGQGGPEGSAMADFISSMESNQKGNGS